MINDCFCAALFLCLVITDIPNHFLEVVNLQLVTYFTLFFFQKIKYMVDGKQQVLNLGMDMQLEWLTLEEFQKHLDGEDENHVSTEPISSSEYFLGRRGVS